MAKMFIAIDFDGTLCESVFPEIGKPKHKTIDWVRKRAKEGHILILWTCRENIPEGNYLAQAIDWCADHDIFFDYVNQNPECDFGHPEKVRKIVADIYLDDKALNVNAL